MKKKAKVLVFDIETTPNLSYTWGKYQQDVIGFEQEWEMLCFAYKWLGEKKTITAGRNKFTEEQLVLRLHKLFDEADVIIAHNGNSFDIKKCNAKFIEYGLNPPSHYRTIDTLIAARRHFKFNSNKLDDLGKLFGIGRKKQTGGFDLWLGCMNQDPKAWKKMLDYNKQDVVLLEEVYMKLRPWMENHPGINVIEDRPEACPKCGHESLQRRGTKHNKTTSVTSYQCNGCHGWCYARKANKAVVEYIN